MNSPSRNAALTAGRYVAIAVFLCGLLCARSLVAQWEPLSQGYEVPSPDGRFVVRVTEGSGEGQCLSIKDRSNKTSALTGGLAPFFSIVWTKDSRSVVVTGHIAGGSYADLFHYRNGQWQSHDVDPLSDGRTGHYAAVRLKMGSGSFRVTFKVADDTAGQTKVAHYLRTLEVDAVTGAVLHAGPRRAISYDAYGRIFLCDRTAGAPPR